DGREGHDARPRAPVLQEGARESGGEPREGQEGLRQARDDQAARGGPRDARGHEGAQVEYFPMPIRVPLLDLQAQYRPIRDEILAAMTRVADSQRFIMGPEIDALE